MKIDRTLLGLGVLAFFSHACVSAEGERSLFDLSLEELLEVKITGATLKPEDLSAVPSAVTVFQEEELDRMAVDTVGELMNWAPGFQSYRSSDNSQLSIYSSRGRRIGNVGADVLVLVDGMRMDVPRTSGAISTISQFPVSAIERIEFIRGPGSALFGSNAMLGVINIVTRSGSNGLEVGAGSFGGTDFKAWGSAAQDDWSLDVYTHWQEDDGDEYKIFVPSIGEALPLRDPRRDSRLDIKFAWKDTRFLVKHNNSKTWGFLNNGVADEERQRSAHTFDLIGLEQTFRIGDVDLTFLGSSSWESVESIGVFAQEGALEQVSVPSSSVDMLAVSDYGSNRELRLRLLGDWVPDARSDLQFGVEYRHLDVEGLYVNSNYDFRSLLEGRFPIAYYGEIREGLLFQAPSTRSILGLFAQYQRELTDDLVLTTGLRYDSFSGIDSEFSPRAGLTYQVDDNNSLKLLYGQAFRAPAESEMNFDNNPFFIGNPDLEAETVETIDLIWMGMWENYFFSIGAFVSDFDDAISIVSYPGGQDRFENVKLEDSKGFEFEISRQVGERWMGRATFTRFSSKPSLSFREAEEKGTLMINYQGDRWNGNFSALWTGGRQSQTFDGSIVNLDDYWSLDAKVTVELIEDLSLYVKGKNLADEQHFIPALSADYLNGLPSRGREFRIGLKRSF